MRDVSVTAYTERERGRAFSLGPVRTAHRSQCTQCTTITFKARSRPSIHRAFTAVRRLGLGRSGRGAHTRARTATGALPRHCARCKY